MLGGGEKRRSVPEYDHIALNWEGMGEGIFWCNLGTSNPSPDESDTI